MVAGARRLLSYPMHTALWFRHGNAGRRVCSTPPPSYGVAILYSVSRIAGALQLFELPHAHCRAEGGLV